jgi:hypothetical protein
MRSIICAIGIYFALAATAGAQPTQAQYDSLAARVGTLERMLGTSFLTRPPARTDFIPENELGSSGRYPYIVSDYQIRLGLAEATSGLQAQIAGLAVRVAAAEGNATQNPGTIANTVNGNLRVTGKLILGDATCARQDAVAQIFICALGDVAIHNETNHDNQQYQGSGYHVGQWTMARDAGMRILQNGYVSTECVPAVDPSNGLTFQNCKKTHVDPNIPTYGQFGPDRFSQWSWVIDDKRYPHEYTQDLVLRTYEDQKTLTLESWRPGWTIKFATSTGFRTIDKWYPLPPQQ